MNAILGILGALGGLVIFVGAVWALLRGLIRQSDTVKTTAKAVEKVTRENTVATDKCTQAIEHLNDRVDELVTRIAVLEDRSKAGPR